MKRFVLILLLLIVSIAAQADLTTTHGHLKLVHAKATPTSQKVSLTISEPASDQILLGPDVTVNFRIKNWKVEKNGKHLHFILDDSPFVSHYTESPFVFKNVAPGPHVIRVFPVYPWHESVKQQTAIAIVQFYVKEKSGRVPLDLSKPMMVYSTPSEVPEQVKGQPHPGILVDWFLHNVSMGSRAGYLVRISLDGTELMAMKEWRPHYVQGLKPGDHKIKLELLKNGVPVPENWSVTERTIRIK